MFTDLTCKISLYQFTKSLHHSPSIAYHALQNNHVINWDDAKVLQMEIDASARCIRESIWFRKSGTNLMNRDEGAYFLNHVYDPLLTSLDDRKTGSRMQRRKSLWRSLSPTTDETVRSVSILTWFCLDESLSHEYLKLIKGSKLFSLLKTHFYYKYSTILK